MSILLWEEKGIEVMVTVDRADQEWTGQVGVVPMLFYRARFDTSNTVVFSCGPGDHDAIRGL